MNDLTLADLNAAIRESENSPGMLEARVAEIEDKIYSERRQHGQQLIASAAKVGVFVDDAEAWIASVQFDDDGSIRNELKARIYEAQRE
jgi:hypothetical protein